MKRFIDFKDISWFLSVMIVILLIVREIQFNNSAEQTKPPVESQLTQEVVEDTVTEPEPDQPVVTQVEPKYSEDDLFCMAAAIYNEAGGDAWSDDTRRLVGYVILNRVNHLRYPNTIREVLEQQWQYGRFCITGVKFADRYTLPQEQNAVARAYRIAQEVLEAEEVPIPKEVVYQAEFQQGTSIYKYQDGFYFCCW